MIVKSKSHEHDGSWRLVLYETDGQGKCEPHLSPSDMEELIDVWYEQRVKEFMRLFERLRAGEISPVSLFLTLHRIPIKDAAARVRLRQSKVKAHLTPAGFDRIDIRTLKRYARLFDIGMADFFQFIELAGDLDAQVTRSSDGLAQHIKVSLEQAEPPSRDDAVAPGGEP